MQLQIILVITLSYPPTGNAQTYWKHPRASALRNTTTSPLFQRQCRRKQLPISRTYNNNRLL